MTTASKSLLTSDSVLCRTACNATIPFSLSGDHVQCASLYERGDYPSRSNGKLSESRPAADCIARLSAPTAASSRSCECPAAVRISDSSHEGDKIGTDT